MELIALMELGVVRGPVEPHLINDFKPAWEEMPLSVTSVEAPMDQVSLQIRCDACWSTRDLALIHGQDLCTIRKEC
jgi:hypothetical protein